MSHHASLYFWRAFDALSLEMQDRAYKQFALLKADPNHPSLHFKKIGDRRSREIWSARVSLRHRALAIRTVDGYLWFWIGDHQTYDGLIS